MWQTRLIEAFFFFETYLLQMLMFDFVERKYFQLKSKNILPSLLKPTDTCNPNDQKNINQLERKEVS